MIVRIMGEGQYRLDDGLITRLNELDDRLQEHLDHDDEPAFSDALNQMLALIRSEGSPLPPDTLLPSDAVLPPEGSTTHEIHAVIDDEGLIPG